MDYSQTRLRWYASTSFLSCVHRLISGIQANDGLAALSDLIPAKTFIGSKVRHRMRAAHNAFGTTFMEGKIASYDAESRGKLGIVQSMCYPN